MKLIVAAVVACAAAFAAGAAENASYVWWEGENPVQTNFPEKTWFSASTFEQSRHEILSGGDWLTNDGARTGAEAFARYEITVPAAGQYSLWARKFWKHGPFRWRFGRGEWQVCGSEIGLANTAEIRQFLRRNCRESMLLVRRTCCWEHTNPWQSEKFS